MDTTTKQTPPKRNWNMTTEPGAIFSSFLLPPSKLRVLYHQCVRRCFLRLVPGFLHLLLVFSLETKKQASKRAAAWENKRMSVGPRCLAKSPRGAGSSHSHTRLLRSCNLGAGWPFFFSFFLSSLSSSLIIIMIEHVFLVFLHIHISNLFLSFFYF